ncbi:large conductance mechanosensitive channel protein MscL [soil metagenome]
MLNDFRDFLMRGNVVDLAVAFVIGAAFASVATSFTEDILTPLLGLFGVADFSNLVLTTPGGAVIAYGKFFNALISFVLIGAAVFFFVVKPMNALESRRQEGRVDSPRTKKCTECSTEIPITARRCPNCTQPQPVS